MNFLDYSGLQRFLDRLKTIIPTKTSDIQNDSGYLTQHNPVDSALSTTSENAVQNKVVKDALDGKSDTGHTHTASEVSGLSTVATSGSYNDLSNTPTIPTVNNAKLTIQRNGTTVKTFTANASSNVTANITVPTAVSELTNDSGYLTSASSLDSSKLTGTIDIARLPKGALERLVTVANQTARFALTTSDVQLGDTVKQLDTGVMYIVTDESKLSSADGYTEYTAGSATSVPWSGVTGKPSSFTPSSHTHGNVTNDGKLPTASRALISDSSKKITVSSVTDTELGYLSGVTSTVQTQLNAKADDSGVVHKTGNETISGTKTFSNSTNVDLSIQKGISSGHCNIRFNDDTGLSRTVIRSYNDKLEIGHLRNANWYDGAEFVLKDDGSSKIKSNDGTVSTEVSFNPDSVKPTNSAIDLGTSSNKWKSVYADAYYLGTTAFGDIVTHNASEFSASNHVHGNITTDGKVGTTANKPLITGTGGVVQAGSFGNAANTFCEGNDSRLSDARTPVSHTHTKSDVTDLFNSANTWTENQFLKNTAITDYKANPSADTHIGWTFRSNENKYWGGITHNYFTTGVSEVQIAMSNWKTSGSQGFWHLDFGATKDFSSVYFCPSGDNSIYLGKSDKKWKNVYATTFTGNLTGNVTGDVTGNVSGSSGSCTGNATTATEFNANQDVTLTGDVTGTASSKAGWSVATTLANSGVIAGTYGPSADVTGNNNATISVPEITVDAKGRVTSVTNRTLTCKNNTYSVYNKTLTIQKNGTNVATFTSNSNTDVTANITVPTKVSELTNDSGFLTSHQSLSNYVTLDSAQTITGSKSFNSDLNLNYANTDVDDIVNSVAGSATLDNFVHMTGNETVNGIKSFPDGVIANVTGSATSATNDGSGNVISSTYGKLGANNTWTGRQTYTDFAILYKSSKLPATLGQLPSENINPLRQYIGLGTGYDDAYFIHDTQINADGMLFYRWTVYNIDHSDNAAMWLQIHPASQDLTKKLIVKASVLPQQTGVYNLGKSDLQWKSVYAQTYYYNGTPWGLDKQNEWTNYQRMICNPAVWYLRNNTVTLGTAPSSNRYSGMFFEDINGTTIGHVAFQANKSGTNSIHLNVANSDGTNTYAAQVRLRLEQDGSSVFIPEVDNTTKLGDSGNHWKDCYTFLINGINPGALSLPSAVAESFNGDLTDKTGNTANTKTWSINGWGYIFITNVAGDFISVATDNVIETYLTTGTGTGNSNIGVSFPIVAGRTYYIFVKTSGYVTANYMPTLGNV